MCRVDKNSILILQWLSLLEVDCRFTYNVCYVRDISYVDIHVCSQVFSVCQQLLLVMHKLFELPHKIHVGTGLHLGFFSRGGKIAVPAYQGRQTLYAKATL